MFCKLSVSGRLAVVVIFIAVICELNVISEAHYVQWEYHELPRPSQKITPSEIMVDITNDLSYRVLHFHSLSNRNNIAFSPTALTSVLIALYEGSTGRSSLELQNVLGLPVNRDITRIGYRDIHRRLRDNPLVGLSLNKENVTITPEYEAILKFYGYDLGMDMVSSSPAPPTSTPAITEKTTAKPEITTTERVVVETTPMLENKLNEVDEIELTTEKIEQTTISEATTSTTIQTAEPTDQQSTIIPTTPPKPITTQTVPATTQQIPASSTQPIQTSTPPMPTTTDYTATESTSESEFTETTPMATSDEFETTTFKQSAELRESPARQMAALENPMFPRSRRPIRHGSQMMAAPMPFATARQSRSRSKRHYFDGVGFQNDYYQSVGAYPYHQSSPATNADFDTNVYLAFIPADPQPIPSPPLTTVYDDHQYSSPPKLEPAFEIDPSYYLIPKETSRNNIINHIFYLNPQETIQTTYKTYNSILNYKYLEELKMSVLELELDSDEYNLVILLPDFNVDMDTAIASLKVAPTLRLLRKQLRPRWVQAIIPDFQMKGNIFLTNDLQNMGVHDIFEPSRADFTPMSDDNGIYTKHIEQSINVHIRTRSVDQIKRNIATQHRPVELAVNHPFLFFIVDKELDVALMAGKVLNPLNVRIQ